MSLQKAVKTQQAMIQAYFKTCGGKAHSEHCHIFKIVNFAKRVNDF